jgi:hypothetical protein
MTRARTKTYTRASLVPGAPDVQIVPVAGPLLAINEMKALGGRWSRRHRAWMVPVAQAARARKVLAVLSRRLNRRR